MNDCCWRKADIWQADDAAWRRRDKLGLVSGSSAAKLLSGRLKLEVAKFLNSVRVA